MQITILLFFSFFNNTATTEISTLSLHDALPISRICGATKSVCTKSTVPRNASTPKMSNASRNRGQRLPFSACSRFSARSEEHTSELQSRGHLVCRLLLEKKNTTAIQTLAVYYES